jgi:DNA topoisomerase VI subunit B
MAQTKLTEEAKNTPIAHELAKGQKEISVAEFFEKNRHLLGFDNKRKALLTTIKEAVDNSLDACEEASILPEINVEIIDLNNDKYRIIIEDNGPGVIKAQIPKIFAKLLYGSKFHKLSQSRGQQGIGISAAALYGQLTTGKPIRITSKIAKDKPAQFCALHIDTKTNKPEIVEERTVNFSPDHGTRIELDLEGFYQKGQQSVDTYLKQTAVSNPHATIIYTTPKAEQFIFAKAIEKLPKPAEQIKPHPYGVELGILFKMVQNTSARTLQSFLSTEFCRVSASVAKEICEKAKILPNTKAEAITREMSERLINAIKDTKMMSPPTDCLSPIGGENLEKGLRKEINAEFYCSTTRPPAVYRGNPFQIECAIAYGGELPGDKSVTIFRFANRVPLQFQQGACGFTQGIQETNWKSYGLQQSRSSIPAGPAVIAVHMSSVWVPFTSEAKEALAHYPEIIKEIKLALQECGRKLASYTKKKKKIGDELKKRSYIEKYIPFVSSALKDLLDLSQTKEREITSNLKELLEKKRGAIKDIKDKNLEYDANFAKIGKEEQNDEEKEE